jgi:hypothetical protein
VKVMDAYLGGANVKSSVRFLGSANRVESVTTNNYYLRDFFDEATLARWGVVSSAALLAVMLALASWTAAGEPSPKAEGQTHFPQAPATNLPRPWKISKSAGLAGDTIGSSAAAAPRISDFGFRVL